MKKNYNQPEWEILLLEEDMVRTSGSYDFDDGDFGDSENDDTWEW